MKRKILSFLLAMVMLLSLTAGLSGCGNTSYGTTKVSSTKDTTIGNLKKEGLEIVIPAGAFEQEVRVTVEKVADNTEAYINGKDAFLTMPIEIKVEGTESVRLNEPVKISMKLDQKDLPDNATFDQYVISYWTGDEWEIIIPDPVQLSEGYLTFETWHFSSYSGKKMTDDEQVKEYARYMAIDDLTIQDADASLKESITAVVDDYLDGLGLYDQEARDKILKRVMKSSSMDIAVFITEHGVSTAELGYQISELVAQSTVDVCAENPLVLETVSTALGTVGDVAEASAALIDGDYNKAAGELAAFGASVLGYGGVGAVKSLVELSAAAVEQGIMGWKEYELECAYKAYYGLAKENAYGYKINAGDWEDLMIQMRGYYNQLVRERKDAYKSISGKDKLTNEEQAMIERQVESDLKKKFEERAKIDSKIDAKQAEYEKPIKAFKDVGLFTRTEHGFNKDMTIQQRLHSLFRIRKIILDMVDGDMSKFGSEKNREENLAWAIRMWLGYGKDRGKFYDWMREQGYLEEIVVGNGYWECIEVRHQTYDYNEELTNKDYWSKSKSGSAGTGTFSETYVGPDEKDDYAPRPKNGESAMVQGSVSTPPKYIDGGKTVQLKVDLSISSTKQHFWDFNGDAFVRFDEVDVEMSHRTYGAIDFTAKDADGEDVKLNIWLYAPTNWRSTEYGNNPNVNVEVSAEAPYGSEDDDKISIYTSVGMGSMSSRTEYVYLWHNKGKAPTE